jgi:magnesium-transporting ATPase (P-type)
MIFEFSLVRLLDLMLLNLFCLLIFLCVIMNCCIFFHFFGLLLVIIIRCLISFFNRDSSAPFTSGLYGRRYGKSDFNNVMLFLLQFETRIYSIEICSKTCSFNENWNHRKSKYTVGFSILFFSVCLFEFCFYSFIRAIDDQLS